MNIPRIGILHTDYATNVHRFSVQTTDDLNLLPRYSIRGTADPVKTFTTAVGSRAFVRDTGATYELNAENKWQKISVATSSGSGSGSTGGDTSGDDDQFVTEPDIDQMFPTDPDTPTDDDSTVEDETLILPDAGGTVEDETWIV